MYLAVLTKAANVLELHIPKSEGLTLARERQIMQIMKTATLDPIVSEFETQEHSNAYDIWFKTKVQEAMNSKKPVIFFAVQFKVKAFLLSPAQLLDW